jgi:FAD/FMN-containing dehydrogenase
MNDALQRLSDRVRAAREPLAIRGDGSKDFYGEAELGDPLSTEELRGVTSYDPSELVVTVQAGTPIAELETMLAEQGQYLPFEPPRFGGRGTIGGAVASGLAGPARAALGGVRDYVLGATLLNGRGELLSFGGQVMKNVAGYDVSRLLAGSLGVLGVICDVSLKVLPVPRTCLTLEFEFDEAMALQCLNAWAGQPLPLQASAWHDGRLHMRLAGAHCAVHAAARRLAGKVIEPGEADALWRDLRDHAGGFHRRALEAVRQGHSWWRISVPSTTRPLGLPGDALIEHGGAQRWLVSHLPAHAVRDAAAQAGGHATLFRALDKSAGVFAPLPPPLQRLHRALKQAFDPRGLFNPGRLYPYL